MRTTSEEELQAVLRLEGPARFEHFVKRVVDEERAWGLWREGWAMMARDDGAKIFPLWPAREYAEQLRTGEWSTYESAEIPLQDLLKELLPQFEVRDVYPGVFPTPGGKGVVV